MLSCDHAMNSVHDTKIRVSWLNTCYIVMSCIDLIKWLFIVYHHMYHCMCHVSWTHISADRYASTVTGETSLLSTWSYRKLYRLIIQRSPVGKRNHCFLCTGKCAIIISVIMQMHVPQIPRYQCCIQGNARPFYFRPFRHHCQWANLKLGKLQRLNLSLYINTILSGQI